MRSRLRRLARETGSSTDSFLDRLIRESIEDLEDVRLAETALLEHHQSEKPTATLEDVMSRLGLGGGILLIRS